LPWLRRRVCDTEHRIMPRIGFNATAFGKSFIGNRVRRWLKGFFDGIGGKSQILFCIEKDKSLLDYIPPEQRFQLKTEFQQRFASFLDDFTDVEVYTWLPNDYMAIIEAHPSGKIWVYKLIKDIRDTLGTP